jgi:hypothetical protein
MPGLKFGVGSNMREIPPGETATIKLAHFTKWEMKDTEFGLKHCIPIVLFSHPSYDDIPSKGIKCNWLSKAKVAEHLFDWVFVDGDPKQPKTFDFDIEKEFKVKWKLTRHETKTYEIEQLS